MAQKKSLEISTDSVSKIETPKIENPVPAKYTEFTAWRRTLILLIVTIAGMLGPIAGNIYIPILPELQKVFSVSHTAMNGTVSAFMAVFAFAPLLWASWADFGGRKTLYIISLAIFIISNVILAATPPHIASLYVFRVIQAFGASSVMSLGAGTIADVTPPKGRGKAISYFMLGPQLGPVLGPVLSLIGTEGGWRWIFGFLAIFGAVVYCFILFFLPETLRYLVGNGEYYQDKSWLVIPQLTQKKVTDQVHPKPPKPSLRGMLKFLRFKPVFICSLIAGLLFASFYGMIVTFGVILKENYNYTNVQVSVSYICPGVSLISGSIISGRVSDYLRQRRINLKIDNVPEHRLATMIYGLVLTTGSIIAYGWIAQNSVHVSALFIFVFLCGFGMTWVFVINTTYLTESSPALPATNVAIGNMMRNLAAAISSAIIDILTNAMGYGWCFTGLGFVSLLTIGLSFLLMRYGPKWREECEAKKAETTLKK